MRAVLLFSLLMLAACGSDTPPPPPEPAPRQATVFDDQLKAIDKAKSVEEIDKKRLEEMDKQIDAQ